MSRYNDDSTMSGTKSRNNMNKTQTERMTGNSFFRRHSNLFDKSMMNTTYQGVGPIPRVDLHHT